MSKGSEFHENTVLGSGSAQIAAAASERFFLEFSSPFAAASAKEPAGMKVASNDGPVILLPAPAPEPVVHTGMKDGSQFIVIETPHEFK